MPPVCEAEATFVLLLASKSFISNSETDYDLCFHISSGSGYYYLPKRVWVVNDKTSSQLETKDVWYFLSYSQIIRIINTYLSKQVYLISYSRQVMRLLCTAKKTIQIKGRKNITTQLSRTDKQLHSFYINTVEWCSTIYLKDILNTL